jgi:hypothetical protein
MRPSLAPVGRAAAPRAYHARPQLPPGPPLRRLFKTVDGVVAAPDRGKDIGIARRDGDAFVAEFGGSILARLVVFSSRVSVPSSDGAKRAGGLKVALRPALQHNGGVWFGRSGKVAPADQLETCSVRYKNVEYIQRSAPRPDWLAYPSNSTHDKQYDDDDKYDTDDTDATVTVSITVAAKAATEATKQENNEDDNEDGSERHGLSPMAGAN